MKSAVLLHNDEEKLIKSMNEYTKRLRSASKSSKQDKEDSKRALIRMGVISKNGNRKKTIVSWE